MGKSDYYVIGKRLMIHDIEGRRNFLDPEDMHMSVHMLECKEWEPHVRQVMKALLRPGDVFVDVGANIGLHTLYAASLVGEQGKVIAFEPVKRIFGILADNISINGYINRVRLVNKGVSDEDGQLIIHLYEGQAGGSSLGSYGAAMPNRAESSEMVDITTLDREIDEEFVRLVKADVEGFEYKVLKGASKVVSNKNTSVLIEWLPSFINQFTGEGNAKRLLDYLTAYKTNVYIAKYGQPLEKFKSENLNDLLEISCDLLFTNEDIDELAGESHFDNVKKNDIPVEKDDYIEKVEKSVSETNEALIHAEKVYHEAVATHYQLKAALDHSTKAFYEAVDVQNELKRKLMQPKLKDLLRCVRNFLIPRKM